MEAGDICVIFFGAGVPFVIRPCEDSSYYLVGECYIHGMMKSEEAKLIVKEKEEWFCLL
jgi:hypothetical protein